MEHTRQKRGRVGEGEGEREGELEAIANCLNYIVEILYIHLIV